MSSSINPDEQRVLELLAGKVLGDLSESELAELDDLPLDDRQLATLEGLDLTAAALQLALSEAPESLPIPLREQLLEQAGQFVGPNSRLADKQSGTAAEPHVFKAEMAPSPSGWSRFREAVAWLACAAALLLAVGLWNSRGNQDPQPSLADARQSLLAQASDLINVPWSDGKHPFSTAVTGDVVWSTQRQEGYMRFDGMPANDPTEEQYQLWIIDPDRDDEPIDGGVFDIPSSGEVVIQIDPKLGVINPAAFAITIEKPGGVVVSTQERLPLLAAVN